MHRICFVFLLILICRLPAFGQHACEETLKKIPLSNLRAGDFDTDYSEYDDSVCVFTLRGRQNSGSPTAPLPIPAVLSFSVAIRQAVKKPDGNKSA